jgi:glycosyltransferase involved in cell wall biosynthesis
MLYSIVVPIKDEEDNIVPLTTEIEEVMTKVNQPWELIFVEDGSSDKSLDTILNLQKTKPFIRTVIFDQNYGQSSAFDAGFKAAKGEFVITLDGDRQNDPADIPLLIEAIKHADLVCGKRVGRKDPWSKKITSRLANAIRNQLCADGVSDTGCSLKIYRRKCLERIKMFHGLHRFLPALFRIEGLRVTEVPVRHRHRTKGKTKYSFLNRYTAILDMFAVRWMSKRQLKYNIRKEV